MYKCILSGSLAACLFLVWTAGASAHGGGGGFHGGGGGFHGGGGFGGGHVGGFGGAHVGGFGGAHVGGYGGLGGFHGGYTGFNRTPSFSMPRSNYGELGNVNRFNSFNNVNRAGSFNNINRTANFNNVNRFNNFNNVNRFNDVNRFGAMNNLNVAHQGGWGWHNPYWGYHQGWMHGYWNGNYPGNWGWGNRWGGYPGYWGGWGGAGGWGWGLGAGLGWGLSSWLYGPMLYDWGYSSYYNPYYYAAYPAGVVAQPLVYDYSVPLSASSDTPDQTVMTQAMSTFDAAREAFKSADYPRALDLGDQALKQAPNDPVLHEFRAIVLFALKRYDEAAAALYAVLSVGPGWDWTTLISLYADPETYTQQLRALEDYCTQNPNSAPARFVLAYQYLTEGFPDDAIRQLKNVVALQPKDQLSAQLMQQLERKDQAAPAGTTPSGGDLAQYGPGTATGAAPAPAPAADTSANAKQGNLKGSWNAQPTAEATISLAFEDQGRFVWTVTRQGKSQAFNGSSTFDNGILTLVQDQNKNNVMVGNLTWKDDDHFTFKVMGSSPEDPGLSFSRTR
jgi:tetratricopeptide (TPR) repeat protein